MVHVVGAKVCQLTDGFCGSFVCCNFDVSPNE